MGGGFALADSYLIVTTDQAVVYTKPDVNSKTRTKMKKGRRLTTSGEMRNGFFALKTKSGRVYWIQETDVQPPESIEDDLAVVAEPEKRQGRRRPSQQERDYPTLTWDLGASTGKAGGVSYTEANLGLNYYLKSWLVWRNALWGRFASGIDTIYGLDSSIRFIYATGSRSLGFTAFAGPGYRFASQGISPPFAEAGVVFKLGGFNLGGGVKSLFFNMVNSTYEADTQFFIILSGGGSM